MAPSSNRGRVFAAPLGTKSFAPDARRAPPGWEGLADGRRGDEDGVIIRNLRTGGLALLCGGAVQSLDQAKAAAALESLQGGRPPADLVQRLQAWREAQRLTQTEAALRLGVPIRTYQGWEGGRIGDVVGRLLTLVLDAWEVPRPPTHAPPS